MSLDAPVLQASFDLVLERAPDVTARFYAQLFARYPQARALFGRNTERAQQEMLARALAAVIDRIEDAPWLSATLQAMGAKHVDYGVTEPMYAWVGEALIATLAEVAEDSWTPEVERAWLEAYGYLSGLMIEGARQRAAA